MEVRKGGPTVPLLQQTIRLAVSHADPGLLRAAHCGSTEMHQLAMNLGSLPSFRISTLKWLVLGDLAWPQGFIGLLSQVSWLFIVWVTIVRPLWPLITELMVTV